MKYIQIVFLLIFSCSLLAETRIDYYVNLGGIKIADANFIIKSDKKNWSLKTEVEAAGIVDVFVKFISTTESCLLYTSPSPRDKRQSRMPSSA